MLWDYVDRTEVTICPHHCTNDVVVLCMAETEVLYICCKESGVKLFL